MKIQINSSLLFILLIFQYVYTLDSGNCTIVSILDLLNSGTQNPEMRFYLFTRNNFFIEQEIIYGNENSLIKSNFNSEWPVRILVHGWKNSLLNCFNAYIKDAYLQKGDFNVIIVDWSDWSNNNNYIHVASLIFNILGKNLANFTNFLNINGNISYDNMYLIGHSLGAQMSGAAGQYIQPNQYNTIFALDSAGPQFEFNEHNKRIDNTDAKYVESITTNMGIFGYNGIIGHASFYPNYGRIQPYCLFHQPKRIFCNHMLAFKYFAESINSPIGFCAQNCNFYWNIYFGICENKDNICSPKILMGGEPSVPKNGTFYLRTNSEEPFANCNC